MNKNVDIRNKRARFEYHILDEFTAGIQLKGTEIKSIRESKVSLKEAYCTFIRNEMYVKNLNIAEYSHGNIFNHDPVRDRKLLLTGRELKKIHSKVKEKGYTIVPLRLFINERGFAKLVIAVAQGKKLYDKRESIKERDVSRDLQRF